eukprot:gene7098-9685_t
MSELEALTLSDAPHPKIRVHPTVIFSILNNYSRRSNRDSRVIGTLLGEVKDGIVEVSDCFAVPHKERNDEITVEINQEYHKSMYSFHRRNNKKEQIVGWYTTTTSMGQFIIDTSSLIHEFYSQECNHNYPVHLVVDTALLNDKIYTRGFISKSMVLNSSDVLANTFDEIQVEIDMTEAEATAIYHMITYQDPEDAWKKSEVLASLPSEQEKLIMGVNNLSTALASIQTYVDNVVSGQTAPNREIGIMISDAINILSTHQNTYSSSTPALQSKVQDLLMVSYLSTLTETQKMISEKLNAIL